MSESECVDWYRTAAVAAAYCEKNGGVDVALRLRLQGRKEGTDILVVHHTAVAKNDGNNYSVMLGGAQEDHVLHGQRRPAATTRCPLELLAF